MEFVTTAISTVTSAVFSWSTLVNLLIRAVASMVLSTTIGGSAAKTLANAWKFAGRPYLGTYSFLVESWYGSAGLVALDNIADLLLTS